MIIKNGYKFVSQVFSKIVFITRPKKLQKYFTSVFYKILLIMNRTYPSFLQRRISQSGTDHPEIREIPAIFQAFVFLRC